MVTPPSFFVYVLRCSDGSLYTGWTTDIERRVAEHNKGSASKYTRARLPVKLVYRESVSSKSDALKREHAIKKLSRSQKLKLTSLTLVLAITATLFLSACAMQRIALPTFLATKTPYTAPYESADEPVPSSCSPVHIEGLFRHGSRYMTKDGSIKSLLKTLEDAKKRNALTRKGREVLNWTKTAKETLRPGMLTEQGENELFGLGLRMGQKFPELLRKGAQVEMSNATKERAQLSRVFFTRGLASVTDVKTTTAAADTKILRYFDHCQSHQTYKGGAMRDLIKAAQAKLAKGSVALTAAELVTNPSEKETWDIADSVFELCQQDYNLDRFSAEKRFCSLLPKALRDIESDKSNIETFYKLGPAANNGMACAVLEPMFERMTRVAAKQPVAAANLAFAHAETVVPVSDFLELFASDLSDWKASEVGPMAANVQIITYACRDGFKLKLLYNEIPLHFAVDECQNSYYCDFVSVKAYYEKRKRQMGMNSCSDADWTQSCSK